MKKATIETLQDGGTMVIVSGLARGREVTVAFPEGQTTTVYVTEEHRAPYSCALCSNPNAPRKIIDEYPPSLEGGAPSHGLSTYLCETCFAFLMGVS